MSLAVLTLRSILLLRALHEEHKRTCYELHRDEWRISRYGQKMRTERKNIGTKEE
jgi:hypothetical protein